MHEAALEQGQPALQQQTDQSDQENSDIEVGNAEEGSGIHDHVTKPGLRSYQFGGDDHGPAQGERDFQAEHDVGQRLRQNDRIEQPKITGAERARDPDQVLRHGAHAGGGVERDVQERRDKYQDDLGELAYSE